MEDNSILARPCLRPRITFLIKGLISSGKSTLFNAIFSKNISKTSMKRQTMCQVILTEVNGSTGVRPQDIYARIESINKSVYEQTEAGRAIGDLPEVDVAIHPIQNFIPRIPNVDYCFVETVGFDDPKTDPANKKWFTKNTKWSDVLLFVTDKEKCMNTLTEQTLMNETIRDIVEAVAAGKTIPLIVIINKVEEPDDDEVKEMIEQCKVNVKRILAASGVPDHPVEFVEISAMTALHYRMFMTNKSFVGMDLKDVARLAEIELGRKGKTMAKDESKHAELIRLLLERSKEDADQWKQECGIDKLTAAIDKLVTARDRRARVLAEQLNFQLSVLKAKDHSPHHTTSDILESSMEFLLHGCHAYAAAITKMRMPAEVQKRLDDIKQESGKIFEQLWTSFVNRKVGPVKGASWVESITAEDVNTMLQQLGEYIRSPGGDILESEKWDELQKSAIITAIKTKWTGQAEPTSYWAGRKSEDPNSMAHAVVMLIELLLRASVDVQRFLLQETVVPIMTEMPHHSAAMQIQVGDEDIALLLYLERFLLQVFVKPQMPEAVQMELCVLFIKKKLEMRDSFPGYTIALRELLEANPQVRQKRFFLFFPVLHEPISEEDRQWAISLLDAGESAYDEHITNSLHTLSERSYVLLLTDPLPAPAEVHKSRTVHGSYAEDLEEDEEEGGDAEEVVSLKENSAIVANRTSSSRGSFSRRVQFSEPQGFRASSRIPTRESAAGDGAAVSCDASSSLVLVRGSAGSGRQQQQQLTLSRQSTRSR